VRSQFRSLLDEINRRSIWQVLVVYLGASWAILEATSLFSDRFGLPPWLFNVALGLLTLGFVTLIGLGLLATVARTGHEGSLRPEDTPQPGGATAWKSGGLVLLTAMAIWGVVATAWLVLGGPSEEESWARSQGLSELEALAVSENWEEAFDLATRLEAIIDDPVLDSLWSQVTDSVTLRSTPQGAQVSRRPYSAGADEWVGLGTTPLTISRFPRGPSVLRFEMDGMETAFRAGDPLEFQDTTVLHPEQESPPGYVWIPGDLQPYVGGPEFAFRYASPNLSHAPPLRLGDFRLQRLEVTNADYREFVEAGGYENRDLWKHPFIERGNEIPWDEAMSRFVDRTGRPGPSTWEISDFPEGGESLPVGGVSWYEAAAYAEFRGRSLPTVYHWFRAATPWRSAWILPLSNMEGAGPREVGSRAAMSQFGTVDMAGNVREWVHNGSGEERFILGGGWEDSPYVFTVANSAPPFDRSPSNGIRLADFPGDSAYLAQARQPIDRPSRDFRTERPVSQEVFEAYRRMYDYDPIPLNAVVESADTTSEWIRERVVIDAAYGGERLPIYLYRPPDAEGPLQTVVYFPGSGALWLESYEDYPTSHVSFLVRGGRAVAFPVYQSTFERDDGFVYRRQDATNTYREHVIHWVKDLRRTVDYLETREDFDPHRTAYFGFSWGGMLAPIALAMEPRLKAAILLVGGFSSLPTQPEVDPFQFVTHVTVPVLMLNGEYDMIHPVDTSARPMFDLLATPEQDKRLSISPVGHLVMYPSMVGETLDWLDRYLGEP
jgi:dienelactone hydrolase